MCNLGSINLAAHVIAPVGDWRNLEQCATTGFELATSAISMLIDLEELRKTTRIAVRMLDNVIDITNFKVERVNQRIRQNRRIGLGVFGLADALFKLRVPYASSCGRLAASIMMKTVQEAAIQTTEELAVEKGAFPAFTQSIYKSGSPRRNAALLTVAPTGSIAIMLGVSGGLEPRIGLAYFYDKDALALDKSSTIKEEMNAEFRKTVESLALTPEQRAEIYLSVAKTGSALQGRARELLPEGLPEVFACALDILPEDHILMQATLQKYVDNSITKTVNLPEESTPEQVLETYATCWTRKIKGGTFYRNNSRTLQVLRVGEEQPNGTIHECARCVD